ncbi:hypothetical protein CEXT_12651 [Caerostris extrusa]|uniref:Uncharacterized protein n=1 Tax=Caerostris extrusa TaxID=172846 RepID=A0AAV4VXE0_CAEEX|nr:hypothetical protein CEXT_12651 [Caerostris extrusa]
MCHQLPQIIQTPFIARIDQRVQLIDPSVSRRDGWPRRTSARENSKEELKNCEEPLDGRAVVILMFSLRSMLSLQACADKRTRQASSSRQPITNRFVLGGTLGRSQLPHSSSTRAT